MVERFKSEMQTTNTNDRVIVIAGRRVVWLTNLHRCQDITPYREAQKEPWTLVTGRPVALQPEILTVEQMEAAGHFGLYEWEESFNRRMAQLSKGIFE